MLIIFKKIIPSLILAILVMVQLPLPALAATDAEVVAATDDAVEYLADKQNNDGSIPGFDSSTTEWTVVAVASKGQDPKEFDNNGVSAVDFIKSKPPAATVTDLENRVISLSAAGEDTKDLSDDLETFHNNNQIGEEKYLNDDMFGIIAIKASKNESLKPMAQNGLDYLIAHQNADKGFSLATPNFPGNDYTDSEIDMTAAAIVALHAAEQLQLTNPALTSSKAGAIDYLIITQNPDGSFFNAFGSKSVDSTSWALMAFNVIGDSVRSNALLARDWLISNQNPDGSFGSGTFTTPHAIIALLGTSWLLDPAPLTGTQVSSSSENGSQDKQIKPEPVAPSSSSSNQSQVLAATTNDETKPKPDKKAPSGNIGSSSASSEIVKNGPNYSLYSLVVLGLIAVGWFVIQSRQKQGV